MLPIFTRKKIEEFLDAGNEITIPILSLVKDVLGGFRTLYYGVVGALCIATNVRVSVYPRCQSPFLLTVHIRVFGRTRKSGTSSATMSRRWLAKLHYDGRQLVSLVQEK